MTEALNGNLKILLIAALAGAVFGAGGGFATGTASPGVDAATVATLAGRVDNLERERDTAKTEREDIRDLVEKVHRNGLLVCTKFDLDCER